MTTIEHSSKLREFIVSNIEHYMNVDDPYTELPSLDEFWQQIRSLYTVQLQFPMAELTIGDYKQIVESLLSKPRAMELAREAFREGHSEESISTVTVWHMASSLWKKRWMKSSEASRIVRMVKAELARLNRGCSSRSQ
eukprot:XP_016657279.1 PREDICTED: uncharacterized protein LOC107882825 [Acyrthosiphon pisum]